MTRMLVFGSLIFLFVLFPSVAQDEQLEDFGFEDLPEEEMVSIYNVFGLGVLGAAHFLNLDEVQNIANHLFPSGPPEISSPLYLTGFQVIESFFPGGNFRVGYSYLSGSVSHEGEEKIGFMGRQKAVEGQILQDDSTVIRRLEYTASYNAISLDYGFVPFPRIAFLPGIQLGWGSLMLRAAQSEKSRSFQNEFRFDASSLNQATELKALHLFGTLQAAVEWSPTSSALLQIVGSYTFSVAGEWTADNIQAVENVPNQLNGGGFGFRVGLFIGMFRIE